ncbi:unnamed protein product [Heligmosomoides polygyrus]|uniref:Glutamate--cysteine ligase n=1 Tax=Heligmosomoides polygyrus TaxID=6339 RepID=A0A183FN20_HELPZ|nr:unnamed protein product [Heligmosomoides polygyrus]
MGLLTKGHPLSWDETVPHVEYIKVSPSPSYLVVSEPFNRCRLLNVFLFSV